MKRFSTLLGFELKKIARGRVAVASLALCAALLFALTLISEMVARPEGRGARTLTGRAVDDGFVAEVADAAARAGGLTAVPPESPYCQAARWMNRMLGNSVSIADVSGDVAPDMLTAGALYAARDGVMETLYDTFGLRQDERDWWAARERGVERPYIWADSRAAGIK